ncbi:hypothetical protein C4K39_6031 [Pseudomonas sessilinigenes]|nr:hypothetical protein C4K39_6031 [Pseudomonas sessilinigenes]
MGPQGGFAVATHTPRMLKSMKTYAAYVNPSCVGELFS